MDFFTPLRAMILATFISIFLMVIKFVVALLTGSIVVLASAIDSLLDICISAFNYFALKEASKPSNEKFNYGFGKIQYIATTIEGILILLSAVYICYESFTRLHSGAILNNMNAAIWVMILSMIVVGGLVLFLYQVAKISQNPVIEADILHYKSDLFSNGAVLISLLVIGLSGFSLIDPILGVFIAVYIAYGALKIIRSGILMLLDTALDKQTHDNLLYILNDSEILGYYNLKTRIVGDSVFVVVYLIFEKQITLLSAHSICDEIENRIRSIDMNKKWEITTHLEPVEYFENNNLSFIKRKNA
ncbi:cation diffusion facilitator family transporter [Helicobacter sp. 13S00477-4]|uniref:cation diffusion facilitator family transporter n=1 Tax=Helicobacter sp. 13S00477-4 TaxID=1905759 RepID=UPI000BA71132|nr:cation diffusion facilitator family transporter [Helicobacter sp. 13S00477-4]PAF51495.1 hypothetical protein BKH44_05475 [Helicobacter sp. 13S00477-4]